MFEDDEEEGFLDLVSWGLPGFRHRKRLPDNLDRVRRFGTGTRRFMTPFQR